MRPGHERVPCPEPGCENMMMKRSDRCRPCNLNKMKKEFQIITVERKYEKPFYTPRKKGKRFR